jgi:hypothetical protein
VNLLIDPSEAAKARFLVGAEKDDAESGVLGVKRRKERGKGRKPDW